MIYYLKSSNSLNARSKVLSQNSDHYTNKTPGGHFMKYLNFLVIQISLLALVSIPSCGKKSGSTDFVGGQTTKPYVSPTVEDKEFIVSYEDDSYVYFTGQKLLQVEKKLKDKAFWIVTYTPNNHIYYMPLKETGDSTAIDSANQKHWTYNPEVAPGKTGGGGARTYVTEAGLVFAKTGPALFFVSPTTPAETEIKASWYYSDNFEGVTRGCVVSYKRNGERFVGMGWTDIANSKRMFVEFPMLNESPFTIQFDKPHITTLGSVQIYDPAWYGGGIGGWGYSCFIDQKRLIYFAACHNDPSAIDLNDPDNIKDVDINTAAHNASFSSTTLAPISDTNNLDFQTSNHYNRPGFQTWIAPEEWVAAKAQIAAGTATLGSKTYDRTSYAMAGDDRGNILTGPRIYTYAFEPKTETVWGIKRFTQQLMVFPRDCFDTTPDCNKYISAGLTETNTAGLINIGALGPLSSLKDGTIVGLTRTNPLQAYLLQLDDPNDLTQNIKITWLTKDLSITGDPYMYTDFSGATLYAMPTELTIDYTADSSFSKTRKVTQEPRFVWAPINNAFTNWPSNNLIVELRCYIKGESPMPDYSKLTDIKPTGEETPVSITSCQRDYFEAVDIKITPINDSDAEIIDKIETVRAILVQKK